MHDHHGSIGLSKVKLCRKLVLVAMVFPLFSLLFCVEQESRPKDWVSNLNGRSLPIPSCLNQVTTAPLPFYSLQQLCTWFRHCFFQRTCFSFLFSFHFCFLPIFVWEFSFFAFFQSLIGNFFFFCFLLIFDRELRFLLFFVFFEGEDGHSHLGSRFMVSWDFGSRLVERLDMIYVRALVWPTV